MKSKWRNLWGPIRVLNNEPEVQTRSFTNDRLKDLYNCTSIQKLELIRSMEVIDLSILSNVEFLQCLVLERVKFKNLHALKDLKKMRHVSISHCVFDLDEFDGFQYLRSLLLTDCKLPPTSTTIKMNSLEEIKIRETTIHNYSFLSSFKSLEKLELRYNKIKRLDTFPDYMSVKVFDRSGNEILDASKLRGYKTLSNIRIVAINNRNPSPKKENVPERPETPEIYKRIKDNDWDYFYSQNLTTELSGALRNAFSMRHDTKFIEPLLRHPDNSVFESVVIAGLDSNQERVATEFEASILNYSDRLKKPLIDGFKYHLNKDYLLDDFYIGRFKRAHFMIVRLLGKLPPSQFSELYYLFLNERRNFSNLHLSYYKKLLDHIKYTEDHGLVEPIIDLIRYESYAVGGDNVLVKKCFKAIGFLGIKGDISLLHKFYEVGDEKREDVVREYHKMIKKLEKK
ncbi:MAG: hypothetical protein GY941_03975 [Planctomycetes bacterium]|nr:hypothetical protein [Planctomycetota bacterium]